VEHKNTEKIAKKINQVLKGDIMSAEEVNTSELDKYDLIGFGSGIFYGKFHKSILNLVDQFENVENKKAFVFSTSGQGSKGFNDSLKNKLEKKGFDVIGSFACKGFDTFGPFKVFGGLAKGRPNEDDVKAAENFAAELLKKNA
jgi:flavodoxin